MGNIVQTPRFVGLIGFIPRTGGNILTSPILGNILNQLSINQEQEEYQDSMSYIAVKKSGELDYGTNNVRVDLQLPNSKVVEAGYNKGMHDAFAAFVYRNNGSIEIIEARTLEPSEFDKYIIPVTFHARADIFGH